MRLAAFFLTVSLAFGQRWTVQYFYDKAGETFLIADLAFPSAQRGIAVGSIVDDLAPKKPRYSALITSDGGEHWTMSPLKEYPRSIFFLNDSMGWMVTDNAIWFSDESGAEWKRIERAKKARQEDRSSPRRRLITRLWFLDPQHGFATGLQKTVLETHDSGKTWTPVPAAAQPSGNPAHTAYSQIAFDGPKVGVIVGTSRPPRADDPQFPSWMEPERAVKRRQVPTLTLLLNTSDGGTTWRTQTAPLFGAVSSVRLRGTLGLAVFTFNESFEWPSEIYRLNLTNGKSEQVFHQKDRRVTDCASI